MLQDAAPAAMLSTSARHASLPKSGVPTVSVDSDTTLANEPEHNPNRAIDPASLIYVIYTSGSTGKPKGCQLTHANVARLFTSTEPWFGFGPDDVWTFFHSQRVRLLRVGDLGRAGLRWPRGRRALSRQSFAARLPQAAGERRRHGAQPRRPPRFAR